jgi:hypothetical protein
VTTEASDQPEALPSKEESVGKKANTDVAPFPAMPMNKAKGSLGDPMLEYFVGRLDVRLRKIQPIIKKENDPERLSALSDLTTALDEFRQADWVGKNDQAWNEAYRIERLFVLAEPRENLWSDLKYRLAQAEDENVHAAKRLSLAADAIATGVLDPKIPGVVQPASDTVVRSLLLETLEEIHRAVQRKFYSRPIRKTATTRIVWFGMGAFALFMVPYLALYYNLLHGEKDISTWAWLPLYSVATTGLFGALFSRLLYLQSNWDALTIGGLRDAHEFASILLRACVGMIGAVIVFFFLRSEIVSGGLFPDFREISIQELKPQNPPPNSAVSFRLYFPSKSWALLVVWSFLAGFSERLLPSILQDTETTLGKSKSPK